MLFRIAWLRNQYARRPIITSVACALVWALAMWLVTAAFESDYLAQRLVFWLVAGLVVFAPLSYIVGRRQMARR